ncbi:ABC transporter ATP-binding protein [Polynucleobacter asymbioticus]|jgi:branched-chain amino acid transport system ATP-binding protein|uniref:Amino acid/amide ABC transporter ATP-binding protein 2, HAAT family n=2 Tax=Polynucleobacter asymbioticus TaxID=576611 RepID=A4SZM5_POLAQ|nr:ABC transporter ATP-binding protein [Polynucleobacter asymbioticus]ABP34939.1 amino acid/amide ABC transporter ATP-binding protein 2, HAAT family [Polynucleobacter asymbioticus QLW-P1DMWA-1]APB99575.1 ABC transporter ATP-binding protein [Polynucleobacter asymbioticus]APC01881.1 ABC transporter ATP-binding protein [Polynucleobacter asymbioticus]APC06721.1 ABC transporter ATP-binding protein [Polynucleobacter asymbioticus]
MSVLLNVRDLKVAYGGINAVKGIDLHVNRGELVALIGANGAGKSSTLKAIAGLLTPAGGEIQFLDHQTNRLPAYELVQLGLGLVPEGRGVFKRMTILENLQMGAFLKKDPKAIQQKLEEVFSYFPRLKERLSQLAGTLSGGEQQMVAMGRAMMAEPKLLLLDEPSMGLSPIMVETIFDVVKTLSASGMTILLVEQNARLALQMASRAYVMESGLITFSGSGQELLQDSRVRTAYLGE